MTHYGDEAPRVFRTPRGMVPERLRKARTALI